MHKYVYTHIYIYIYTHIISIRSAGAAKAKGHSIVRFQHDDVLGVEALDEHHRPAATSVPKRRAYGLVSLSLPGIRLA